MSEKCHTRRILKRRNRMLAVDSVSYTLVIWDYLRRVLYCKNIEVGTRQLKPKGILLHSDFDSVNVLT